MDRRTFVRNTALGCTGLFYGCALPQLTTTNTGRSNAMQTATQQAYQDLMQTFAEVEKQYLSADRGISSAADIADGHRFLMHLYQQALNQVFEQTPEWPILQRSVTPTMKVLGDNPDAVYHHAPLRGDISYLLKGNRAGAVYFSLAVQSGNKGSQYAGRVGAELNDSDIEFDADGNFELILSATDPGQPNWLEIPEDAIDITVRHYFEEATPVAADTSRNYALSINPIGDIPPPPTPDDESIAAGIRRVIAYVKGRTLALPSADKSQQPAWVSHVPNQIPTPQLPGDMAYAAVDAAYAMSPYSLADDEALVITGKWPRSRYSGMVLWNRYMQTYDYAHRQVSMNRAKTRHDEDGSFRIIVSHRDPGLPNWVDTEGRNNGMMYWRFLLPEEEVVTPVAEVVKYEQLRNLS